MKDKVLPDGSKVQHKRDFGEFCVTELLHYGFFPDDQRTPEFRVRLVLPESR